MDENLYDEFGNYIGPEIESEEEEEEEEEDAGEGEEGSGDDAMQEDEDREGGEGEGMEDMEGAVVLAEDKKYYPTAVEVYGEGVETLVEEEDAQPLEEPLVKPVRDVKFEVQDKGAIDTAVSTDFLLGLSRNPGQLTPCPTPGAPPVRHRRAMSSQRSRTGKQGLQSSYSTCQQSLVFMCFISFHRFDRYGAEHGPGGSLGHSGKTLRALL